MAGRGSKPSQLLVIEGKSHRTKKELEHREKIEKSLYSGFNFKESPDVKSDPVAHKEFLRLKKLYKKIEYIDGLDEQVINRYCLMLSQEKAIQKRQVRLDDLADDAQELTDVISANKTIASLYKSLEQVRRMLLQLEDRLFLNPTARVKSIPKTPPDNNNKSPMSEFIKNRANKNA